ncbi:MAG: Twin-arginine translocation protein TatC [uncultured Arthrobacter sp.]|uniref:Sec-independent protein translocase protein TatC n=1 Tax=uncultured Arthrobacter sp. TaxID=114050 RepID=A0A6J4J9C6_9MICC|nr:twin-arginine translocase subunit TatC [uncultured Arthrobacter sp.]CAA9273846.1 MAG: Twin-arginine translocation protein TatC [uncultured Arthrobacter sp.]
MARTRGRKANPEGRMALKEHLREARIRLFKSGLAVVAGTVVGFFIYNPVLEALAAPIQDLNEREGRSAALNFDAVASPFDLLIQVSVFLGLIISSPVWLYQLWAFITPGLHAKERRISLSFIAVAVPLFLAGIYLAWLVLPNAVRVLTDFTPGGFTNIITVSVFITFILRLMLAFGIAFLLPVVLFGLNLVGLISGRQVLKAWRITVFLVCLFAAMAAPGADAVSMFYLAVPMLVLFFAAIGLCLLNDKRRARRNAAREAELDATADSASTIEGL